MKNYKIQSSSSESLDVNYYEHQNPKGLVQILHGMQEHKERYENFARFLLENSYSVVIHDHLGHGKSVSAKHPLGDMISFDNIIDDVHLVRQSVDFDGEYISFGHSMGSFIARIYTSLYPTDKLVASGTGQSPSFLASMVQGLLRFYKSGVPLPSIQKILMGRMSSGFENPDDWLSLNKENQIKYRADELCGKPFTKEGYITLLDIVKALNKTSTYKNCSAKKILLVSGEKDLVGNFGKGVKVAEKKYKSFGKNVKTILYKNMSHEILNEDDKFLVYNDILKFLQA
ncbi:MAG: alpha/beta fold hydrolase [Treponemataceae bacterium]